MRASRSSWIKARLDGAILDGADLRRADLRAACLAGARGRPQLESSLTGGATARGARELPVELRDPPIDALAPATADGHWGAVLSVAWSPDGARLATGSHDNTACLWDAATGALLRSLDHSGGVRSVAWSPDGARLATGGTDSTVRLWDAANGALLRSFDGHTGGVMGMAWSPDGARLATGGSDARILVADELSLALVFVGISDGWYSLDRLGRWMGQGAALERLNYVDPTEEMQPAPWIPRYWRAIDLPELARPIDVRL